MSKGKAAKGRAKPKRGLGRPSKYTEAKGRAICKLLASGVTLTQICKREGMPAIATVLKWAQDEKLPFYEQYARARDLGYSLMASQLLDIADDGHNDWMTIETRGGAEIEVVNREAIQRSELRVNTRKWLLSKALPKLYGDKLDVKHDASDAFLKMWQHVGGAGA